MDWQEQPWKSRFYLTVVYLTAIPFAVLSLRVPSRYSPEWILLTVVSLIVATVNVRLPKLSVVISMGDVFIILLLIQFGPGPALLTYWIVSITAYVTDLYRRHGLHMRGKLRLHRWTFNLACCALSTFTMWVLYRKSIDLPIDYPINFIIGLLAIALGWFLVNTGTVSFAISLISNRRFLSVWREGIVLYLLNFLGSAAV